MAHVDDHQVVREGLRGLLSGTGVGQFEVVASVSRVEELVAWLGRQQAAPAVDVVVLDYQLPPPLTRTVGVERCVATGIPVVVYATAIADKLTPCITAGAAAVLDKGHDDIVLRRTLVDVCEGRPTLSPQAAHLVSTTTAIDLGPKTARVVELIAQGWSRERVKEQLDISDDQTWRRHLRIVRDELLRIGELNGGLTLKELETQLRRKAIDFDVTVRDGRRRRPKTDPG